MVFLPKEDPTADVAQFTCDVAATRPLTLTDTMPKLMALGLIDWLSALAARTVVGQHRGFVPGRGLADNVFEAEKAMLSFSGMRVRSAAAVFCDLHTAFPSWPRRWMLTSFLRMELPTGVLRLIAHLYEECDLPLVFEGGGRRIDLGGERD